MGAYCIARPLCRIIAAAFLVVLMASAVFADFAYPLQANTGLEGLGVYTGSVSLVSQTLTFSLKNISTLSNGGFLTGFAFTLPTGITASSNAFSYSGFQLVTPPVSVSPWDDLDAGAALGADWLGGGGSAGGIPVGSTGSFAFTLSAAITIAELFPPDAVVAFAARFSGFADGGSDKVPGWWAPGDTPGGGGDPVPEPASLITGALLLGGSSIMARRKKAKPLKK